MGGRRPDGIMPPLRNRLGDLFRLRQPHHAGVSRHNEGSLVLIEVWTIVVIPLTKCRWHHHPHSNSKADHSFRFDGPATYRAGRGRSVVAGIAAVVAAYTILANDAGILAGRLRPSRLS